MPRDRSIDSLIAAIRSSDETWFSPGGLVVPAEMVTSEVNDVGMSRWAPLSLQTQRHVLADLYVDVPGPLPRLFEELLLACRWLPVTIPEVTLLGNPPGPGLTGFRQEVIRDRHLFPALFRAGFVEFGKAPGGSYDPICFDLRKAKSGDCPIVRIDHESVLMHDRADVTSDIARSFRALAERIAESKSSR